MTTGAPEPGTILAGKYRVEEVLGVGGMGVVVAAHHIHLDQRVALKYLLPEATRNHEVVERFAREARAAAKIRGEHVARVIDVGQFDDGTPFIIMEYLEGHDLAKELATNAPLRIDDVTRYILQTCEALAEAHVAGIVHRDLKPQNLFLAQRPDRRSIIKVLDFGISKVETDKASAALTQTSALMGTAFYMSPEQMTTPKLVDHRSDIWSLGVVLYELLTGRPPFFGETVAEVIAAILTNEPEPLRQARPDAPQELAAVVARCMQSKAADRYANVAALAHALAPFAGAAERGNAERISRVIGDPSAEPPPASTVAMATLARPHGSRPPIAGLPTKTTPSAPPAPSPPPGSAGQVLAAQRPLGPFSQNPPPSNVAPRSLPPTMTSHALARSASELGGGRRRRSSAPIVIAVALLVVGVGAVGAIGWRMKSAAAPALPVGLVGSMSSVSPASSAVEAPLPVVPSATATNPVTPSVPVSGAVISHAVAPPQPAPPQPRNAAAAAVRGTTHAAPSATPDAPSATPAATNTVAPAPPAAASSAPRNPLQMGIK